MILVIIALFVIGILLIMLEAVLPAGISATIGFLILAASGYLSITEYGPTLGTIYCFIALVVALITIRITVKYGFHFLALKPRDFDHPGKATAKIEEPTRGDAALVVQPLRPTGTILFRNNRFAARSVRPEVEIPREATVNIVGRDSVYWLVENVDESTSLPPGNRHESDPSPSADED